MSIWKPAWLEKVKPASWSSHGAWGMVIGGMVLPIIARHEPGLAEAVICAAAVGLGAGITWEWAYWQVSRWWRKRKGIVYKARGWPDVPPDALAIVTLSECRDDHPCHNLSPLTVRKSVKEWCDDTGAIYDHVKMSVHLMSARLYIHPAFNKNRGSKLDVIPWALGAALGAVVVYWRG